MAVPSTTHDFHISDYLHILCISKYDNAVSPFSTGSISSIVSTHSS